MPTFRGYDRLLQLSGVDREVPPIQQYISKESLKEGIDNINSKIPAEASAENQLADKQYVADNAVGVVDADHLFSNTISAEQKKQAAMMQVLMLEQMYGYETSTIENPEYVSVILDSEDRIIAGKKVNGDIELFGTVYES